MIRDIARSFKVLIQTFQISKFLRSIDKELHQKESPNKMTIVIYSIRSYIPIQLLLEGFYALILKKRGHDVVMILDDHSLPFHDTVQVNEKNSFSNGYIVRLTNFLLKKSVLGECIQFSSNFLGNHPEAQNYSLRSNEDLNDYVQASIVRYFKSAPDNQLLCLEKNYENIKDLCILNDSLSRRIAFGVMDKLNPDLVISSHGIYTVWGSFIDEFKKKGVNYVTWGGNGFISGSIDFARNEIAANKLDGGYYDLLMKDITNREKLIDRGKQSIQTRINYLADDQKRINNSLDSEDRLSLSKLESLKTLDKKIVSVFPNVMWDNATTFKKSNTIFSSPVEWLLDLSSFANKSDHIHLVIRTHPAEHNLMDVRMSIREILETYKIELKNITLIEPNDPIKSLEIVRMSDICSVYNGTMGLEIIEMSKPLLIGSNAAYSNKGFTYDAQTKLDFFKSLESDDVVLAKQESYKDYFYIFCYEYFALHGVKLPFIDVNNPLEPNLNKFPDKDLLNRLVKFFEGEIEFPQEINDYDFL